ncbi:MAG: phospholipase D family protein [Bacteroidales bacterium]|nr:phospholipase D family protein [Bacteroidales bacterium]
MDTKIIGQGYNLEADTSVAKELIEQFNSKRYDAFTCLVAFASYGGISALTPYILTEKGRGVKIKVILGIDQNGTSKEALEEVLSWGVESKIYHTQSINIFHPKIYLFENTDIFTLIVGSNNLTTMGLVKNIECSLLIKDAKGEHSVHNDFYIYWKSILDGVDVNLLPITQELIDKLYADKLVPTEFDRTDRYDNGRDKTTNSKRYINFNGARIQRNPEGFIPKRRIVKAKRVTKTRNNVNPNQPIITESDESLLINGEEVLIAEIGGGPRWKQVNFPVEIFENFFGAERGNNSYNIKLMNIAQDGSLGEVETRQAVSVKSHNYRFEINCAETAGMYPGNNKRPIGLFIKIDNDQFLYQVLLHNHPAYKKIKKYLDAESRVRRNDELRRHIVHIEAIHALYPELVN